MEIKFRESSPENSSKYLSILPPISQSRMQNDTNSNVSLQTRITILEDRTKKLEAANYKLVEIVFQLKNAMGSGIVATEYGVKTDSPPQTTVVRQLENRLKRVEKLCESKEAPLGKEIDLYDTNLNQLSTRLISLNNEIENVNAEKSRLENLLLKVTDEMLQLKNQFVIQADYLTSSTSQYNSKTKRLHDEYLNNLDSITDKMIHTQESAKQLVNCAVAHDEFHDGLDAVKHEVKQLRMKLDEHAHSLTGSDANLAFRVSELAQKLNDEKKTREIDTRRLELMYQDALHTQDSTRMVLENHLTGLLSESASKQMDRETFTRISIGQKISEFEKLLLNEKETRNNREKEIHARINDVMERASTHQHESVDQMRETLQHNYSKTNDALHQIETGLRLVEQNSDERLRQYYQVISSEVSARKKLNESVKTDVLILEEKIRATTAAMQLAISGLANRIQNKSETDELKILMDKRVGDFQLYMSRNFADIDSQLQIMAGQISSINLNVETRIAQATSDLSTEVRDTLSSVLSWQANSTAHLREMQAVRLSVMQELAKMQLTLNHIESEIPSQMTMETDERIQAIGDIRHQMESLKIIMNSQPAVKEVDVDKIHESIRKLAETLQSIKSTMGMKIQSEQEMRLQQIKDLQTEMRYIEDQFMLKSKPQLSDKKPNYIIKPPEDTTEEWHKSPMAFIILNQWSIYSVYRWTKYKERLMAWKTRASKNKGKKSKKFGGFWKKNKK